MSSPPKQAGWVNGPRNSIKSKARRAEISKALQKLPTSFVATAIVGTAIVCGALSVYLGAAAAIRPEFLLALPLLLAVGFTFVVSPKTLMWAIIVLRGGINPLFEGTQVEGIGGLGAVINLAVIALAFTMVLQDTKRVPRAAWWAWLPFLAIQIAGIIYSPDPLPSARLVLAQVSTGAMFIVAFFLVEDLATMNKAMHMLILSSLPVVALTLFAIATGNVTASAAYEVNESAANRYSGPFPHPNILAFYTVLVISIVLYIWKRQKTSASPLTKSLCALYIFILFIVLFSTKTRSAWLAAAFIFFLYGIFIERRYLVYLLAAPIIAMLVPEIRERIIDLNEGNQVVQYAKLNSFAWRKYIWESGLNWMSVTKYFFGYGYNGFIYHSPTFFPMSGGRNFGAHSVFVQIFFDLGIAGISCYLWLFKSALKMMWPVCSTDRLLGIIFVGILGTYLVISSSDNMLGYLVFNFYFWFSIGAVCSIAQNVSLIRSKSNHHDSQNEA